MKKRNRQWEYYDWNLHFRVDADWTKEAVDAEGVNFLFWYNLVLLHCWKISTTMKMMHVRCWYQSIKLGQMFDNIGWAVDCWYRQILDGWGDSKETGSMKSYCKWLNGNVRNNVKQGKVQSMWNRAALYPIFRAPGTFEGLSLNLLHLAPCIKVIYCKWTEPKLIRNLNKIVYLLLYVMSTKMFLEQSLIDVMC